MSLSSRLFAGPAFVNRAHRDRAATGAKPGLYSKSSLIGGRRDAELGDVRDPRMLKRHAVAVIDLEICSSARCQCHGSWPKGFALTARIALGIIYRNS